MLFDAARACFEKAKVLIRERYQPNSSQVPQGKSRQHLPFTAAQARSDGLPMANKHKVRMSRRRRSIIELTEGKDCVNVFGDSTQFSSYSVLCRGRFHLRGLTWAREEIVPDLSDSMTTLRSGVRCRLPNTNKGAFI